MKHFLLAVVAILGWPLDTLYAESIPAPPEPAAYHYIELPAGGLPDFMAWRMPRIPLISHHRGGPMPGFPENAIETMQNALRYGPGLMEVDVAQLKDGTLILMHDDTLDRTTTGEGGLDRRTWEDVAKLKLVDETGKRTAFTVPLLDQVLKWSVGRAILTLDIKRGVDFAKVAEAVKKVRAEDYVIIITYSLEQAVKYHDIAPNLMQTVTIRNNEELTAVLASDLEKDHILAWTGTRLLPESHYAALHRQGWRVVVGTLGRRETSIDHQILASGNNRRYLDIYQSGADIIATDRFWAVQGQIRNPNIFVFSRSELYR